jgi:hypothetical protein
LDVDSTDSENDCANAAVLDEATSIKKKSRRKKVGIDVMVMLRSVAEV